MKNYKIIILLGILLIFLNGCNNKQEIIPKENKVKENKVIVLDTDEYIFKTPIKFSVARGSIVNNIPNSVDIKEIERGLMDLSKEKFPTKMFLFQEGQYLDNDTINSLIQRKSKEYPDGLNPEIKISKDRLQDEKNTPKILSYILEQNYHNKDGDIKGISIALILNKVYYIKFTGTDGLNYSDEITLKDKVILQEGKKIAEEFLRKIKNDQKIPDVPILLTLYKQAPNDTVKPGDFLAQTYIKNKENSIDTWDYLDREYLSLTNNDIDGVEEKDRNTYLSFMRFHDNITSYFDDINLHILGTGHFVNKEVRSLDLVIKTDTISSPHVVALTQYIGSEIQADSLLMSIPITIRIAALNEELSLMKWDPVTKEFNTHIY